MRWLRLLWLIAPSKRERWPSAREKTLPSLCKWGQPPHRKCGANQQIPLDEARIDGFWSPNSYYGFLNVIKYQREKVVLDKYTIIEADRTRTVYNWLQYFSPEALEREFVESGLTVEGFYGDVAGSPFDPEADEYAVVAKKV